MIREKEYIALMARLNDPQNASLKEKVALILNSQKGLVIMMKRIVSFIMALVMCLSLCACGGGDAEQANTEQAGIEQTDAEITETTVGKENAYEDIKNALLGQWGYLLFNDRPAAYVLEFREDGYGNKNRYDLNSSNKTVEGGFSWQFTYEITDSQIICERESAISETGIDVDVYDYTFENGTLQLSINNHYREYHKDVWLEGIIEILRESGEEGLNERHKEYIDYE